MMLPGMSARHAGGIVFFILSARSIITSFLSPYLTHGII